MTYRAAREKNSAENNTVVASAPQSVGSNNLAL